MTATGIFLSIADRFYNVRLENTTRYNISMSSPFFDRDAIRDFLAECGYSSHPKGLAQQFPVDYVQENENLAYLDINADAVRKGNEVPDRLIRITVQRSPDGPSPRWEMKSAEELRAGVKSKALDRLIPKISPWTD